MGGSSNNALGGDKKQQFSMGNDEKVKIKGGVDLCCLCVANRKSARILNKPLVSNFPRTFSFIQTQSGRQ